MAHLERQELTPTQATAVEDLQNGLIAATQRGGDIRRGQQVEDLFHTQVVGQHACQLGRMDAERRIGSHQTLPTEKAKARTQLVEPAGDGCRLVALAVQAGQPRPDQGGLNLAPRCDAATLSKGRKFGDLVAVVAQRVGRGAALDIEVSEKTLQFRFHALATQAGTICTPRNTSASSRGEL